MELGFDWNGVAFLARAAEERAGFLGIDPEGLIAP